MLNESNNHLIEVLGASAKGKRLEIISNNEQFSPIDIECRQLPISKFEISLMSKQTRNILKH